MRKLFAYVMSMAALLFAGRLSAQTPSHQASAAQDAGHSMRSADGFLLIGPSSGDGSSYP